METKKLNKPKDLIPDLPERKSPIAEDIDLVFFERKPGYRNFSIELVFNSIKSKLPPFVKYRSSQCRYINRGPFRKFYNMIEPLFVEKGKVNHITGDVHYLASFLPKNKTILTIHDVNLMYRKSGLKNSFMKWFWLQNPVNQVKFVTVVSTATKEELLKYVDCPADKIKVINNPVPPHFIHSPKKFNEDKPTILQIGTKPNKNLPFVAEALKGINCRLEIIGKPSEKALRILEENKIEYNWQEQLTDEAVLQKYIESDLLIFASVLEGFGMPIIEANHVGRPVVCSNILSMPEVAGNAAELVDPFDISSIRAGILKVISDAAYREQLISNGFENSKRFSAETIAGHYTELYQELIASQ